MSTLVMKFGGASVATPAQFEKIACIIAKRRLSFGQIAVVVSAMGKATDDLFKLAHAVHPQPPSRELDMLVSVGERISIALLAMALAKEGVEAISFTGSQSGILTTPTHTEARILDVKPYRLVKEMAKGRVVIVAGFQGVSLQGEITTLGRGGSDTSAVAIAAALGAEKVQFFKDVPGIFSNDPKVDSSATLLREMSYEQALELARGGAKVLHLRAVELARKNQIPLEVLSFDHPDQVGTLIQGERTERETSPIYEEQDAHIPSF